MDPTEQQTRAPRVPLRLEAAYEDPGRQVFLATRDVSETGIYLYASEPPVEGVAARVLLELPGHPAILRLSGVVARREPGTGFAVAFHHSEMPSQVADTLRAFTHAAAANASQ